MAKVLTTGRVGGMYVLGSGVATLNLSAMGDESCSEVSSSSPHTSPGALSPPALVSVGVSVGMSPPTSLASSDIGEVDLDFWDLDLNSHSPPHGMAAAASTTTSSVNPRSLTALSDTSSSPGRDDMSPSSLNNYGTDSYSDLKKKKGPIPRQQEELCLVCGDRASGYHYNALTCEGCKGFFRRSITKNAVYQCKYGNNCEMDMYMRRKCQECRLKKCLSVGMRPECVVPESQCQVKREQKKARDKDKKDYPSIGSPIAEEKAIIINPCKPKGSPTASAMQFKTLVGSSNITLSPMPTMPRTNIKPLTREQEELIHTLVYYQEEFEQPSEEDLKKIKDYEISDDDSDAKFKHITDMTILTVQLIVEFSKRLPGFDTLLREDQITLLKACSSEVMMLRAARRYDSKTDSIVFGNNFPYTQHSYELAGLGESAGTLFRFCRNLCKMKVDNAEYALLAAIAIFSERPNLKELSKVEKLQEIYLEALKSYVENRRMPRSAMVFAKLLNILTELRTLGNLNSEVCFSLTLKNKRLPPFLAEIWDVTGC
ncbi:LOW QUALITY PROTEIN: ecdysone receptor-like [Homarus americanus]|uniref:LOW QUALITY PROTEIN: ecdysone receptor-like n=1 Tax=Homarus americanus TaxID=6706 RepID=UPI001C471654|nr:LOW QUALITY PROTEIN: ecdysone receptor-like [Homarus americanus]